MSNRNEGRNTKRYFKIRVTFFKNMVIIDRVF